jgi:DNA polymerase III subunit epsilon
VRWRRRRDDAVAERFRAGAELARAQLELAWDAARFCVLDVETTGLSRTDAVLSFGAVHVDEGRVRSSSTVYGLVRPTTQVSSESVTVHAIRPDDLVAAPTLPEALDPLLDAMAGRVLVAHTAWVERMFLGRALSGRLRLDVPFVDTAPLAWRHLGLPPDPERSPELEKLAQRLGVPVHTPHHALGDALTTAQVFLVLARHLAARGDGTVRALVAASDVR